MKYRGFEIKSEQSHYVVIMQYPPDRGMEWREDTIKDAKEAIDEFWDSDELRNVYMNNIINSALERRNNELPAGV